MMKATTTPKEIKENMQELAGRVRNAFNGIEIPIEMLRRVPTASEAAGIYTDWVDFNEFIERENKWARQERLDNTKLFRDLAGLWNSMKQVKDGLSNDLEHLLILVDQFTLTSAQAELAKAKAPIKIEPPMKPSEFEKIEMPVPNGITMGEMLERKPKAKGKPVEMLDETDDNESSEEEEEDDGEEE